MTIIALVLASFALAVDVLIVAAVVVGKRKVQAMFSSPALPLQMFGAMTGPKTTTTAPAPEPPSAPVGDGPGFVPTPTGK